MKTITMNVYQYSELSDAAKETARAWYLEGNDDMQWAWDDMRKDAEGVGITLESWDYGRYCKGKLADSMEAVCQAIREEHGETCETYKTATEYLTQFADLKRDEYGDWEDEGAAEDLEAEFLRSILEDYRILLDRETDYHQSEEYIAETMAANEYEFDEKGRRV